MVLEQQNENILFSFRMEHLSSGEEVYSGRKPKKAKWENTLSI